MSETQVNVEAPPDQSAESKQKKPIWLTRSMAEEFSRRHVLITTFQEALLFFLFVLAVSLSTIGRRNSSMFYLTQAVKNQFLDNGYESPNVEIVFSQMYSIDDFWAYTTKILVPSFYWQTQYSPAEEPNENLANDPNEQKVLFENKLLGVPRIRQVKVRENSCEVAALFKSYFKKCLDHYSSSAEDTKSFGLQRGTAWVYNSPKKTKAIKRVGNDAVYGAGGFYQDLGRTKRETLQILYTLQENLWVTRGTRAIFIDFTIYNANLNLFCICNLLMELPPTGGIMVEHLFQAVQLIYYVSKWDYVLVISEFFVYFLGLFYLSEEVREMIYFKFRYMCQFWSYIDCTIIILVIANFIVNWILFPNVEESINTIKKNQTKYGNMEHIGYMKSIENNLAALLLFFTYIKIFKYLNFNKTMGQLNNTLKRCAADIFSFSIMFIIIFFAFAQLGYMLFGSVVNDFSSVGIAMFTLLRTILGDFDYEGIEKANEVLAPFYFVTYIFLVFFVLLNMFLAIINDTYADVKTEIAIAPDEMQMTEFIKMELTKFLARLGFKFKVTEVQKTGIHLTISLIREALKKCGFTDLEIEMFFARYNIDPLAEMGSYDMKSLLKELEAHSTTIGTSEDVGAIQVNDFIAQQDRLVMIEQAVIRLAVQVDLLIKKLEELDQHRKAKSNK